MVVVADVAFVDGTFLRAADDVKSFGVADVEEACRCDTVSRGRTEDIRDDDGAKHLVEVGGIHPSAP